MTHSLLQSQPVSVKNDISPDTEWLEFTSVPFLPNVRLSFTPPHLNELPGKLQPHASRSRVLHDPHEQLVIIIMLRPLKSPPNRLHILRAPARPQSAPS